MSPGVATPWPAAPPIPMAKVCVIVPSTSESDRAAAPQRRAVLPPARARPPRILSPFTTAVRPAVIGAVPDKSSCCFVYCARTCSRELLFRHLSSHKNTPKHLLSGTQMLWRLPPVNVDGSLLPLPGKSACRSLGQNYNIPSGTSVQCHVGTDTIVVL